MFVRNKKGEMTSQQIVILIIMIVSFAVLLYFLFRLNLGSETEKEVCHNSVVTRGSSIVSNKAVPLNCQRNYVCITKDGSCESMTKPIEKKVKTKEDIYDVLANEMVDCWWMFGEGKINYIGEELISGLYCSICSQIAFDDSVKDILKEGKFNENEFYRYLALKNLSGESTNYLEYLYGIGDIVAFENQLDQKKIKFKEINLDKQYYVVMGIHSQVGIKNWVAGGIIGATVIAGAIVFLPITVPAGILTTIVSSGIIVKGVGAGVGYLTGITIQGLSENEYLATTIIEANSQEFEGLECKEIATRS